MLNPLGPAQGTNAFLSNEVSAFCHCRKPRRWVCQSVSSDPAPKDVPSVEPRYRCPDGHITNEAGDDV